MLTGKDSIDHKADIEKAITINWINTMKFLGDGKLDDHAAIIGITPEELKCFCLEEIGEPFKEFRTDLRLEFAMRHIITHNFSANQAALYAGFKDDSNFRKLYSDRYGLTPSQDMALIRKTRIMSTGRKDYFKRIRIFLKYGEVNTIPEGMDETTYLLAKSGRKVFLDKCIFPLLDLKCIIKGHYMIENKKIHS